MKTPTASSATSSQREQTSLLSQMPRSPRSNVCSMPDPENPSASVHRKRFSTPSLTLKFLCAGKLNPREIIRRPGLVDALQRECRIVVTGPTTLMALLNSLRMGFRTLAIQKRSSEVWQVLAAVKTEFGKYGEVLEKVQQKLHEASNTIDKVSVRRRAIDRRLRGVEILPEMEAGAILSLPAVNGFDSEESAEADNPEH